MIFGRTRYENSGVISNEQLGAYYYACNIQYPPAPYFSPKFCRLHKVTSDYVHKDYPKSGGPFEMRSRSISFSDSDFVRAGGYVHPNGYSYMYAPIRCVHGLPTTWNEPTSYFAECESYGPACWARFKPAKPNVSLSVFIAELRDIPGLMLKKLNKFRNLGSNYLGYQFGWKPFLSDIRSWYESCVKLDRRIAQLQRDNGRWIRRGGTLFVDTDITQGRAASGDCYPNYSSYSDGYEWSVRESKKVWFSGAFRYYIPGLMSNNWGRLKSISKLWDLELGPEQIYQLIPFSWLLDWFTNVGDVVGNFTSQMEDNLTAKYAYVMLESTRTTRRKVWGHTMYYDARISKSYQAQPFDCSYVITEKSKNRVDAHPFGFNVTTDSLSAYQLSILSALGISRLKF